MVRVTVLGSGDAFGSGGRLHSAYLVEAPGVTFLLDCGPTILQALKRVRVEPSRLDFVAITHLHGDHFGGIPFLFMEYRYEDPRTRPLGLLGPAGLQARVDKLFAALYEKQANEPQPHAVHYGVLDAGQAATVDGVKITPLRVPHVPELVAYAYRIEVAGRTILYSGDSAWTDDFVQHARGVDLFLCECSTFETRLDIHVAYPEVAAKARDLGCKRLLLSHLGSEVLEHESEISLECARDGMTLEL